MGVVKSRPQGLSKVIARQMLKKVKFKINASGQFNLCYGPGDVAELDSKQADLLLEAGAVELIEEPKQEQKEEPKPAKKVKK